MCDAQKKWIDSHYIRIPDYCSICQGKCELSDGNPPPPKPPKRTSSVALNTARRALVDAAYYFLTRCYRIGLLNDNQLKQKCDLIGTSIDPTDLEK